MIVSRKKLLSRGCHAQQAINYTPHCEWRFGYEKARRPISTRRLQGSRLPSRLKQFASLEQFPLRPVSLGHSSVPFEFPLKLTDCRGKSSRLKREFQLSDELSTRVLINLPASSIIGPRQSGLWGKNSPSLTLDISQVFYQRRVRCVRVSDSRVELLARID